MIASETLPRWDLSNVYPGLESPELAHAVQHLRGLFDDLDAYCAQYLSGEAPSAPAVVAEIATGMLTRTNTLLSQFATVRAYLWSFVTTDSYNTAAKRQFSEFQQLGVRLAQQQTQFQGWLGRVAAQLPEALAHSAVAADHAFFLTTTAEQSRYLMSQAEEALAAELSVSGVQAWGKLQGVLCSQLAIPIARNGQTEHLPLPALQNLYHDGDREVRRRAYEAEIAALAGLREPLAACFNGVKGGAQVLNRRRGFEDDLQPSLIDARIDRATLDALLGAMRASFPAFRRYLKKKAERLGVPTLAWYDLVAPVSRHERAYTFPEAEAFVGEQFRQFSPGLAAFAERAFAQRWVDAEPRKGKRGGAFCMAVPAVEESRILMNFDGSLDQVFTLAHELGHGFHNACQAAKTPLQRDLPMTLAETASTFCETIITEAALARAAGPEEELTILETFLIGATQVVVDIASRFLFEQAVFERRAKSELSADELCELMIWAQTETYGEALDPAARHPYMWTWKPHYYYAGLSFYNYPYTFGLLFGIGLYAIYRDRGPAFVADYERLLASTGEGEAADLAARFGIDIRAPAFWANSLKVIEARIERYLAL